jgi:succinate dehydrogenase / fumarate reductase flavoprotein subunit
MIDLLIVGSGGAGLSAALEAKKSIDSVTVLSKTYPTSSQTSQAQGGINGILDEVNDSKEEHFNDTMKSAHGIGDEKSIRYLCENSDKNIKWLDDLGVPFSRDENSNIAQRKLGGAKHPRACYSSDYTGLKILHTLYDNCIKEEIEFINEHMLISFIVEDNTIKGITALDIKTSQIKQILAKRVIIASGGYGGVYHGYTTNSTATTGDSVASAIKAGCEVSNMEYIQFHPTSLKNNCILISESARGEGGHLITKDGSRFVDELKPRDEVARAIYAKQQEGEEVYLDLRHLGYEKIMESMPQEYQLALEFAHLKLDQDLIPIMPAAHYTMGGIKTDIDGKTSIENLFAVGECSSNGVHGANRLGGNSLLELVVFGRNCANSVIEYLNSYQVQLNKNSNSFINDKEFISQVFSFSNQIDFYERREFLGKIFYRNCGIIRKDINLKAVLQTVRQYQQEYRFMGIGDKTKAFNTNLIEFLEFGNMLELAEVILVCAISRIESRGSHFREDYPLMSEEFNKNSISWKEDGVLCNEFR